MNREDYEILVSTLPGSTRPPDYAVKLLEDTCVSTGLDWKLRHLYLMNRGGKWGVTLSIDGFRRIGSQHPEFAGQEGPFWVTGPEGTWTDIPPERAPYAAKVGIKHRTGVTTWGVAKFADYQAGPMWAKFPSTMIAKCAEMLAWRKAFPGSLGGLYGLEEMAQGHPGAKEKLEQALTEKLSEGLDALPGDKDAAKNAWLLKLNHPKLTREELAIYGKSISQDKSLSHDALLELHKRYNELKSGFNQD